MAAGQGRAVVPDGVTVAELRQVAEAVALEAADLVRTRRAGVVEVADLKSSATDVVTAVDRESEELLRDRLAARRPGDGFFGEEGTSERASETGVTWVVDPIDGTVNFLYDLPHYCVSVAAVDDQHRTLAGAVVDVPRGTVFTAALGEGSTRDGRPLRVRPVPEMSQRLVITGYQYQPEIRRLQGPAVARLVNRVRDVRRMGSAALEICAVGAATADAYVEEGLHLWDRAAATLVATEAGARIGLLTGVGGMECVLCAPEDGYDDFLAVVREVGLLADDA